MITVPTPMSNNSTALYHTVTKIQQQISRLQRPRVAAPNPIVNVGPIRVGVNRGVATIGPDGQLQTSGGGTASPNGVSGAGGIGSVGSAGAVGF